MKEEDNFKRKGRTSWGLTEVSRRGIKKEKKEGR